MVIGKAFESNRNEFSVRREKAVLVTVALPDHPWLTEDPFEELRGLAETAGADVVGELSQKRQEIHLATYIGSGKIKELEELTKSLDADVVIFDNDLNPAQARNLEKVLGVKVLDRSEVILDIFATRARTLESKLQVELAQLEYSLPRLKNMWTHLSRQDGAGIGTRGPGETQLESDRRLAGTRIRDLKTKLAEVQARKEREVAARGELHTVSLVGYTNAGKSRLMNQLTKSDVYVENKLFSTLDTQQKPNTPNTFGKVLLSDTVGFIRNLPHGLVASFKATLEEVRRARLLLHVVDASNPIAEEQILAVNEVLTELACEKKPTILVLNKIDKLTDRSFLDVLRKHHPTAVAISGMTGEGVGELRDAVIAALSMEFVAVQVTVNAGNGKVISMLNAHAEIFRQELRESDMVIRCFMPTHLMRLIEGPGVEVKSLHESNGKPPEE